MAPIRSRTRARPRRPEGWTAARQLAFLDALAATRSVTAAAAAAGMSRESAYRLSARDPGGLFALLWTRALAVAPPVPPAPRAGHGMGLSDGKLLRALGNHFRRKRGDFAAPGAARASACSADRTRPL